VVKAQQLYPPFQQSKAPLPPTALLTTEINLQSEATSSAASAWTSLPRQLQQWQLAATSKLSALVGSQARQGEKKASECPPDCGHTHSHGHASKLGESAATSTSLAIKQAAAEVKQLQEQVGLGYPRVIGITYNPKPTLVFANGQECALWCPKPNRPPPPPPAAPSTLTRQAVRQDSVEGKQPQNHSPPCKFVGCEWQAPFEPSNKIQFNATLICRGSEPFRDEQDMDTSSEG